MTLGSDTSAAQPPRRGRWLLQGAVTVLCIGALAWQLDVTQAMAFLSRADPLWLAAAAAIAVLDRIMMIGKWLPLLSVQAPVISPARAARSYLAAGFTNYFLPATVGSDALRAASLGRPHGAVAEVAASIAAERMLGAAANALLVLLAVHIGVPAAVSIPALPWLTLLLAIVLVGGFWLPLHPSVRMWLERWGAGRVARLVHRFTDALLAYRHAPLTILGVGVLTLIEVFFPTAIMWLIARALAIDVSAPALLVAVPLSMLVAKLPISINGVGPQEASLVSLLVAYGLSAEEALALAIPSRAIDVLIAIPGAWTLGELWRDLQTRPSVGPEVSLPRSRNAV